MKQDPALPGTEADSPNEAKAAMRFPPYEPLAAAVVALIAVGVWALALLLWAR